MKKVLYISNIEVPYRVSFFNELAKECDLTVLYERKKSKNRDEKWTSSEKSMYKYEFLKGINIKKENSFDLKIIKYIFSQYDEVIFGCFNSPIQILCILIMKLLNKKYSLNIDGEIFLDENTIKTKLKKLVLKGANKYYVAGEKSARNIQKVLKTSNVYPYYFSSLFNKELNDNQKNYDINNRQGEIIVVGQYYPYKGLDIALDVALKMPNQKFKFIGMGNRSEEFKSILKGKNMSNIEIIPFLEKKDLEQEYKNCKLLILPSRQECWGLVINEAASFGAPIISTKGSGAAVEFLEDEFNEFLCEPNNSSELYDKVNRLLHYKNIDEYKTYLIKKSKKYSIENSVKSYINAINSN